MIVCKALDSTFVFGRGYPALLFVLILWIADTSCVVLLAGSTVKQKQNPYQLPCSGYLIALCTPNRSISFLRGPRTGSTRL